MQVPGTRRRACQVGFECKGHFLDSGCPGPFSPHYLCSMCFIQWQFQGSWVVPSLPEGCLPHQTPSCSFSLWPMTFVFLSAFCPSFSWRVEGCSYLYFPHNLSGYLLESCRCGFKPTWGWIKPRTKVFIWSSGKSWVAPLTLMLCFALVQDNTAVI